MISINVTHCEKPAFKVREIKNDFMIDSDKKKCKQIQSCKPCCNQSKTYRDTAFQSWGILRPLFEENKLQGRGILNITGWEYIRFHSDHRALLIGRSRVKFHKEFNGAGFETAVSDRGHNEEKHALAMEKLLSPTTLHFKTLVGDSKKMKQVCSGA